MDLQPGWSSASNHSMVTILGIVFLIRYCAVLFVSTISHLWILICLENPLLYQLWQHAKCKMRSFSFHAGSPFLPSSLSFTESVRPALVILRCCLTQLGDHTNHFQWLFDTNSLCWFLFWAFLKSLKGSQTPIKQHLVLVCPIPLDKWP